AGVIYPFFDSSGFLYIPHSKGEGMMLRWKEKVFLLGAGSREMLDLLRRKGIASIDKLFLLSGSAGHLGYADEYLSELNIGAVVLSRRMKDGERKSRAEYLISENRIRTEYLSGPFQIGIWTLFPQKRTEGEGLLMETENIRIGLMTDPENTCRADWIHYSPYLSGKAVKRPSGFGIINNYLKRGAVRVNLTKKKLKVWDQKWMSIK
ncbi:MAG TPA: hypothetical protein VJC03_00235, partial [bacterium]|nr:hypothetical protein [bacterium]